MPNKKTIAGLGATLMIMGGVDASVLNEKPIERVEMVTNNRVEAKQIGNKVETTLSWKDQAGIKVSYDMGKPTIGERFADKRKREVITEKVDFMSEDGTPNGFKVDILLNEKPTTNVFCYDIEGAENYDFFYQPEITDEEAEQNREGVEDTRTLLEIKRSIRPENIVGSYAVYHKTLKNHEVGKENYATGKVMHIPRPQVWSLSSDDTKIWADMHYDEKKGQLCVTAPQSFLDSAEYPVRIDPTFGYTSVGASNGVVGTSGIGVLGGNPGPDQVFVSGHFNTQTYVSSEVKGAVGIYRTSDLALVDYTDTVGANSASKEWKTASAVNGSALPNEVSDLYVFFSDGIKLSRDSFTGGSRFHFTSEWPTFLDPMVWNNPSANYIFSLYATYTASSNTCIYSGSGDWNVDLADNCYITTDVWVDGGLQCTGTGSFTIAGAQVRAKSTMCIPTLHSGGSLIIQP